MHLPTHAFPQDAAVGALADVVAAGIVVCDGAGRLIHANAFFAEMVGYTVEELLNQAPPFPYWAAGHVDDCMAGLQAALDNRFPEAGIRTTFVRKSGENIEKLAEQQAEAAESAYRTMIESSTQGMPVMQGRRVVFANPAACALTGREVADLLGRTGLSLGRKSA